MSSKAQRKGKRNIARIPRKTSAAPSLPPAPWDHGATGPANQIGLVTEERGEVDLTTGKRVNPNGVFGKVRMPVFMRYMIQKRITAAHAAAAQRIYAAYAGHPTRDPLAAITDRVDGGGDSDPNVTLLDRRREFYSLKAMIPARCWPVVEHVVLDDRGIKEIAGADEFEAALFGRLTEGLEAVR